MSNFAKTTMGFLVSLLALNAHAVQFPQCVDSHTGQQVPILTNVPTQDPAFSTINPQTDKPVIVINLQLISQYESSQDTLNFIVLHECGHVNLGHLTSGVTGQKKTRAQELAADCYAAEAVHQLGYTEQDLQEVIKDVSKLPADPDHPSGTVRAKNIVNCYNNGQQSL